jgi:hypothetical protein
MTSLKKKSERFHEIEEKEKNILLRLYPYLKEEYQQFIYQKNYSKVEKCLKNDFPEHINVD